MRYFPVRYDSRVVIYERKMFIRLATGHKDLAATGKFFQMGHTWSLFRLFSVFSNKQTVQFLQQINVKNVHPVHDAEIQTHASTVNFVRSITS